MGDDEDGALIVAWVTALTCALVYVVLAGCAPTLAQELKLAFIVLIVGAWARWRALDRRRG